MSADKSVTAALAVSHKTDLLLLGCGVALPSPLAVDFEQLKQLWIAQSDHRVQL